MQDLTLYGTRQGLEQKVMLRRLAKKKGLTQALSMEKQGMSVPYNTWKGRSGWDRTSYFDFLKETWKKCQAPEKMSLPHDLPRAKSPLAVPAL